MIAPFVRRESYVPRVTSTSEHALFLMQKLKPRMTRMRITLSAIMKGNNVIG
jgi:hypothetical protein